MDRDETDANFTVQTLLLAAGWSLHECQSYAKEHTAKQKKLSEFEASWTVSESVIDLELVVLALNLLDENTYQLLPNWQKQLVDFFVNQRQTITMEEQQVKRRAVYRKIQNKSLQPEDMKWLDNIRTQWKLVANQMQDFDAFKVAMDWILRPPAYRYTAIRLLVDANRAPSQNETEVEGHHVDHVVELQLVAAALNRLWETTYSLVPDWQRKLVDFFNGPENLQLVTVEENEQKRLAVSRAIHCPAQQSDERAWLGLIRTKWTKLRDQLEGFVAFKAQMDSLFQETDSKR